VVEHSRSRCGSQKQRERERERGEERRTEREGEREREREREKHDPIDILRARPHLLKFPYLTGAEHMCWWTFSIQIITLRLLNEENKNNEEKNQQLQQFKKMA
jgi:hypothetical protein